MRQVAAVRSSLLPLLCQSALFLTLLPLPVHSQGDDINIRNCNPNCNGHALNQVCASNGVTYDNTCEMELAACLNNLELDVRDNGPCNEPDAVIKTGETCAQHRDRITSYLQNSAMHPEWDALCSSLANKSTITMRDLIECYTPSCDVNSYAAEQCHYVAISRFDRVQWCWCSGPMGLSIPDTLTNNMQNNQCTLRQSCNFQGSQYSDGEVFLPNHRCGVCECLDGNVTCFDDFVPDLEGKLNTTQLNQLSDLLKLFFYFEEEYRNSILYDIRIISRLINATISSETQTQILYQWFQDFDTDGNGYIELNHTEEISFHNHVHQFTSCRHFLDHISEVFDVDGSGSITLDEWLTFFNQYTTMPRTERSEPSEAVERRSVQLSRSTQRRKSLQNRKKFYYTLS